MCLRPKVVFLCWDRFRVRMVGMISVVLPRTGRNFLRTKRFCSWLSFAPYLHLKGAKNPCRLQVEATWQILPPDRFLQAVSEDLTSGHLVNVQQFLARSVFTIRKKLSHESDQAQQDLSKNAIKSVSYFVRTCVKCVCARVLRVLDFFCILLLIAHFSVIGVCSFEFALADDETQDNFCNTSWV